MRTQVAKPTILVAEGTFANLEAEHERLQDVATLLVVADWSPASLAVATPGADAVAVALHPVQREHLDAFAPSVRVIGRAGIGLDSIDLEHAARMGVAVVHQPDYATNEVATHAMALLLTAHRRLSQAAAAARGSWASWQQTVAPIKPIEECTVGVVGSGRIGRAVVRRLAPFAGRILTYDPYANDVPDGAEVAATLEQLLSESDIVTLHLPLTRDTRHVVDATALAAMPAGALVVNVSRGGLIDEDALADALRSKHIGGAALDVFDSEPLPQNSPLFSTPNTLLTPHMAWYSESSAARLREQTLDGVLQYLAGEDIRIGRVAVGGGPRTAGGAAAALPERLP